MKNAQYKEMDLKRYIRIVIYDPTLKMVIFIVINGINHYEVQTYISSYLLIDI